MKVVYFGTYRDEYSRNRIMIASLRSAGVNVIECHEQLWLGIEDRVQAASGGWLKLPFLYRLFKAYFRLVWRGIKLPPYDVMICGYPGQFDVYLARIISAIHGRPLVWDVFMSIYLIAVERGLDKKSRITCTFLRQIEKWALRLPDRLIQDTNEYVTWLINTHSIARERFRLVPTGADDRIFHPTREYVSGNHEIFTVLYYGTFIPNHGVPYIIEAARLLQDQAGLQFDMVGEGPELSYCKDLVKQLKLQNVRFFPLMPQPMLVEKILSADICLGAFGKTPQSLMTIQNKIYEGLAMAKPVITGDSPVIRGSFVHGTHLYCCNREDPRDLAEAIRILQKDPLLRQTLADNGYNIYREHFTVEKLGQLFKGYLCKILP